MNINFNLIKKIERILELSKNFDNICSSLLNKESEISKNTVQNVKELTFIYMAVRTEHGAILLLNDKLLNEISKIHSSKFVNELYDLSTFTSISDWNFS